VLKSDKVEELRKIQVTGGSTYIISLPKTWVEEMKLVRGSVVRLYQNDDMSLIIRPKYNSINEKPKKVVITIDLTDEPQSVIRSLVSTYHNGYTIIEIRSSDRRIEPETRHAVKDFVRKKLVGTEILSDLPNELTLQILLSYSELSIKDTLRRMSIIAASMHRDAIQTLSDDNPRIAKEVMNMDDEVDRFSFYVMRLLSVAVMDVQVLKESGIVNQRQCLGYRLITKSIERMADHATNIAENRLALHLVPIGEEILEELNSLSKSALLVFEGAMEALLNEDYTAADKVMYSAEKTRSREDEVIHKMVKLAPREDIPQLRLIVESIVRTSEYGEDIAETAFNMMVSDVSQEE
jgi:phosphate uptake regulator